LTKPRWALDIGLGILEMAPSPDLDQLSAAISHAMAPAFMLGAVAAFLNILISRTERIIDRLRFLRTANAIASPDIMSTLSRRMEFLNHGIYFAVLSGLSTAALLVISFSCALLGINHRTGVAVMFVLSLLLLMVSLVDLVREVRLNLKTMHWELRPL
jgi:hypothetical protein